MAALAAGTLVVEAALALVVRRELKVDVSTVEAELLAELNVDVSVAREDESVVGLTGGIDVVDPLVR